MSLPAASFFVVYVQAALKIAIAPIVKSPTFTLAFNLTMFIAIHASASVSATLAQPHPHVIFGTPITQQVRACPCTSPCILQSTMPSSLLSLELRRRQLLLLLCSRHVDRVRAHTLLRHRADIPGGRRHRRRRHACWHHVVLASVRRLHVCRRRCRLSCRCISRRFCV